MQRKENILFRSYIKNYIKKSLIKNNYFKIYFNIYNKNYFTNFITCIHTRKFVLVLKIKRKTTEYSPLFLKGKEKGKKYFQFPGQIHYYRMFGILAELLVL